MERRTDRPDFSWRRRTLLGSALAAAGAPSSLFAADPPWPSRPIRMIVPFAAGGSLDVVARIVADNLGKTLGTSVVVDNRTGANGIIGNGMVAHAPPDGYMLLMNTGAFTGSAVAIGVLATLVLGIVPEPLLRLAHDAASQLFVR